MSVSIQSTEPSLGHFTITAHRSLSDTALRRILIVGGLIGAGFDLALFLAFGAVVGLITLFDLLFLGLALGLHQRGARAREEIVVASNGVFLSRVPASGQSQQVGQFPLIGIELTSVESPDGEIERLMLGTAHRRVAIGQALLPSERRGFRDALLQCLREAGVRPLHRRESRSTASAAIASH
jgi:uncharacterized membrane protein